MKVAAEACAVKRSEALRDEGELRAACGGGGTTSCSTSPTCGCGTRRMLLLKAARQHDGRNADVQRRLAKIGGDAGGGGEFGEEQAAALPAAVRRRQRHFAQGRLEGSAYEEQAAVLLAHVVCRDVV